MNKNDIYNKLYNNYMHLIFINDGVIFLIIGRDRTVRTERLSPTPFGKNENDAP